MKMKQIEVTIMGQSYLLGCPPGGDVALLEAVSTVDREMTAIKEAGRVKARERIAVLAALNLAYALAGRAPDNDPPLLSGAVPGLTRSGKGASTQGERPGDTAQHEPRHEPQHEPQHAIDDAAIAALLRRLDQAIAGDDHLL